MKRIFSCLITIMVGVSSLNAGVIEHTFSFDKFRVEAVKDGYSRVFIDGAIADGPLGDPAIPYYQVKLLLPADQEVIAWDVTGEDTLEVTGTIKLYPCQPQIPVSTKTEPGIVYLNDSVYLLSSLYPSRIMGAISTQYFNGYPVAMGAFTPVIYNPLKGKVYLLRNVHVKLYTRDRIQSVGNTKRSVSEANRKMLSSIIQNPEALNTCNAPCAAKPSAKMLIITKEKYKDGFGPLVNYHNDNGVTCSFAFIEKIITEESGVDEQEKIRNRIIKEKKNSDIGYVLLGGDTSVVKARFLSVESETMPADIYYAALDGNWNKNNNNAWGEQTDSCDLLPDVSVGRLPFGNTIKNMDEMEAPVPSVDIQLQNMITKIVQYQKKPVQGELNKPLLIGELLDLQTSSGDILDLLIGEKTANGITTKGIPENDKIRKWYFVDDDIGDWYNVDSVLNEGSSAIYHSGHGQPENFMGMYFKNDFEKRLKKLDGTTKNLTFINSLTCHGGAFHNIHSVANRMLASKNYLVALIGNSIPGRYDPGSTDGASPRHMRLFVNALYNKNFTRIGDAHLQTKIAFSSRIGIPTQIEPEGNRVVFYCCNLLGDPAMNIWIKNDQIKVDRPFTELAQSFADGYKLSCVNNGPNVNIKFIVTKRDNVRLSLLDCKGRRLELISGGNFDSGIHNAVIEKGKYATGFYLVELLTSKTREVTTLKLGL